MPGSKVTTDHQQPAAEEALTDEGLVSLYSETESALQRETPPLEPVIDELCALLGPHVNNLVRNQNGAIDLTRVPAENFLEFRQFLVDQAGVNDGILFGSPYSELVAKKDHEILFQLLYREINSDYHISRDGKLLKITGYYAEHLLYEFKKELIEIDAEAFAKNHLSSEEGRRRLAGVFDEYAYDELKINLAKGIARAGKGVVDEYQADLVDEQVGGWNYFNIGVTDRELEGAVKGASAITRSADRVYADVERRQRESVEEPEKIVAPSFDPSIDSTTIAHFARLAEFKLGQPDPVSRLQGRLARLWLWAADDNNWGRLQGGYEREEVNEARAYVLENATEFIQRADLIGSEEFLETFNDKLQDFLRGPIDSSLWDKAADLTVGAGLDSLVQNMLAPLRAPFDDLLRFSDEIKFSQEMGEKIFSPLPRGLSAGHLAEEGVGGRVAAQFIDGLQETKRSLWYSYKQHKFISRAISNTASLFNRGDIVDIERANALIDEWIDALSRVPTEEMIGQTIEEVFRSLSEGGALYTALVASEMEGIEQTLGLLQTTLILVATSIATSGVAAAAGIAARMAMTGKDLQAARAALLAARTASATVETVDKADSVLKRMGKAFGYGAYISTAENAIAVGTGEVRGQPDTLVSWGKDALSTGLSMAVTGALPVSHGGHNNVIGNLFARYTVGGVRGVAYLGMDAGVETVEEGIDQYVRQTLDGNATALSGKQWRELALLSSAGGFAKVGTVAEMIRGKPRTAVRVEDGEPSLPPNDRDNVLQFPRSDGAGGGGWSPDSITEDHEFEDNESSPDEAPGKPDDLAGVKSADDAYGKRVDKAPDRPKRLNCILLLASRQEKYQRGSRERFKAFVSKLDAATLDHACYLLKKLSTDDSRKALLRLVGDADLPLKIEERAFVVDVMRRHYSKFGDPAHYLENYVKTAGSNSGGNGHFFELQALKKLEDHPFISIEKISVKYDGHEVDLHLKIGDHELLVELKRSLGTMDASRVGAQLNWLGPLCRKNDYGLSVVVSERERIWPGAVEFVEGKGVPVFALDEFLHLTPEQFERLRDDFLAGNGKSGLKGGGDPYTPEDHEDFGISEDPVDDGDFKTEGDGDVLPEISQIIALTDKARRNGLTDEEIGYLVSSLKDADFTVSYWILEALFTLAGKDPGRITPAVVRALETKGLDHPNGWIAGESKKALGRLAKKSPPKIAQEAARALKKTGRGPVNSARVQKSGSVAPGIKAPATAENSALEKAAGTAVAAVLEEALMKGIERWTSGWRTVGREEFKRRLGQIDFNGFWRETRKSHPGLKQVRLALSANLLSGSASAVSFHLPHESLSRCANYTMVDLSFDERGVAVTDVHGPHAYLPLAALFGNSSVRFEPSLLRRAAAAILEEGFMAGRERSLGDWAPMTHAEFLRRWARTDFDSTWRQMKKTRPELERLEGAMTAVTRGKGIIEGVSMIPAGGPLPKGNYLFVHLSFDENGPSATGAIGLNPRLVSRALLANPTLDLSPDLFRRAFCDVLEEDFFRGKERSSHGWPSLTWPELEQRLKETDFNRPSAQPFGAVMAVGIYGRMIRSISVMPAGRTIPGGDNYAYIHLSFDETGVRVTDVRGRNKKRLRILLAENRSLEILPGDFFNEKDPDGLMPTAEELERDQGKAGGPPVHESPGRLAGDKTNEISSAEAAVAINYVQTLPPYNHRSGEPQGSSHRRDYLRDMETGMERDIQWHKAGAEYFDLEVTDPESARKILNEMRKKASERKEGFMGLVAVRASGDAVGFREFVVSPNENGLGVAFSEIYILSGHRKKGYRTLVDSVIIASLLSGMKGKGELKVQYVKVHNPDNRRKYEAAGLKNISPPGVEYPSYEITHSAADFRARLDSTEGGSDSFPAPPLTLGPGYFKWDPSDLPLTPDRFTERLGRIRQKLAGLVLDVAQGMKKLQRPQSFWKGDVDLLHKRLAQIREELGSFYLLLDKRYPHEQFSDGAKALQGEMETIRREMDELEAQIIVMKQADILKQVERELEDELDLFERLREVCEDEKEPLSPESAGRFQRDIGEIEQRLRIMGVLNSGNEDIKRQGESVLVRLSSLRRRVEALADVKNGAAGDRGDEDWELIDDEK